MRLFFRPSHPIYCEITSAGCGRKGKNRKQGPHAKERDKKKGEKEYRKEENEKERWGGGDRRVGFKVFMFEQGLVRITLGLAPS